MTIQLRDYQNECLDTILSESKAGIKKQLISLPTGSGKTVIMSAAAKHLNKKTLILAHREELIQQAIDKFQLFWPDVSIGVCMAERDEIDCQIVVGSVQSCSRPKRLKRLKEQGFKVMMIDEAHHSVSSSYQKIIKSLGFVKGKKLLIGVTATPQRADKQGLGNTFDKIVFSRSIGTMIKAGYLSPVIGRKILTSFVLEKIRLSKGDFSVNDLAEAVNTHERNSFIVEKFKTYAQDRKAVCFCVDVQHCKDLAEAFNKEGIVSAAVWGDMETDQRKQVLADLKTGKVQLATSCGVLIEGFDEPSINAVIMARPTKSPGLYTQCVGRGLRLWPGKDNCLVLDFTDRGHNLDSIMTLSTAVPEAAVIKEEREHEEHSEIDKTPKIECLGKIDQEFDILGARRFIWIPIGDDEWSLLDDEKHEIIMRPEGKGYTAILYYPNGSQQQITNTPIPLEYCSGLCEDYARRSLKIAFCNLSEASWMLRVEAPTEAQRIYLENLNAWDDNFTKAQASLKIRRLISLQNKQRRLSNEERRLLDNEPITQMQKYFLDGRGMDTQNMTKLQAMKAISKIKQAELEEKR
jgi:ATP-dependent helicase IRC3